MNMKSTYKALILTSALAFLAGCATPTTPQSSTYWVKNDGSSYQTHRDRIKTHDKRMECQEVVDDRQHSKSLTKEEALGYFKSCMQGKHYVELPNYHPIKETAKK